MVNNDRIIPIQKIDYLSLIGTVLALLGVSTVILAPDAVDGRFTVTEDGDYLANQPVKILDFSNDGAEATVLFVPAYNFAGITLAGSAVDADVLPDGVTLYKAALSSGEVEVLPVTPSLQ